MERTSDSKDRPWHHGPVETRRLIGTVPLATDREGQDERLNASFAAVKPGRRFRRRDDGVLQDIKFQDTMQHQGLKLPVIVNDERRQGHRQEASQPFVATPSVLWWKDFELHRDAKLSWTLTNVSPTFASFRLLPMDPNVVDLFHVVYEKPGRMAAGSSCTVTITFTGREEKDLVTTLVVASPMGTLDVPMHCTCKKALPLLQPDLVEFPDIVAGERARVDVLVKNEGALPFEYYLSALTSVGCTGKDKVVEVIKNESDVEVTMETLEELAGLDNQEGTTRDGTLVMSDVPARTSLDLIQSIENESTDSLAPEERALLCRVYESIDGTVTDNTPFLQFPKQGFVAPYGTSTISLTFVPTRAMQLVHYPLQLSFAVAKLRAMPLAVSGRATPYPVSVAPTSLNFHCCAYGQRYRHHFVVHNRGQVAGTIHTRVPKPLRKFLQVQPTSRLLQAAKASDEATIVVHVTFCPQETMWQAIEHGGYGSHHLGLVCVPIQIKVPAPSPVPLVVFVVARVSTTVVHVQSAGTSSQTLEFGTCCIGHGVQQDLVLTNMGQLTQRMHLTSCPIDVTPVDSDVVLTLLPHEKRVVRLVYLPTTPGKLVSNTVPTSTAHLTLVSSTFHQVYHMPCTGLGVLSHIHFSHTVLRFGATSVDHVQTCHVFVTNRSNDEPQSVAFHVPFDAAPFLTLSPLVVSLAPQATRRVELAFRPTEALLHVPPSCVGTGIDAAVLSSDESTDPKWYHTWTIVCFQPEKKGVPLQALTVHTTVVPLGVVPSRRIVDFGHVAIGHTVKQDVCFESTWPANSDLRAYPLHVYGAFQFIGTFRAVSSTTRVLSIAFTPLVPKRYDEDVDFAARGGTIRVHLCGTGMEPLVSISPSEKVEFLDVLAHTRHVRDLIVTNQSPVPVPFSIVPLDEALSKRNTWMGVPVYTFFPSCGTLGANESVVVHVVFQPDRETTRHYCQKYRLETLTPNMGSRILTLSGRCWENELYVYDPFAESTSVPPSSVHNVPLSLLPLDEDLFELPPSLSLPQFETSELTELVATELRKPAPTVRITFAPPSGSLHPDTVPISRTRAFLIGGTDHTCEGGTANGVIGSFELHLDPNSPNTKFFTLDPSRGSIVAGQQVTIQVTCHPPRFKTTTIPGCPITIDCSSALYDSQWVEVQVQCHLKSGTMAATAGKATLPSTGKGQLIDERSKGREKMRTVRVVLRAWL